MSNVKARIRAVWYMIFVFFDNYVITRLPSGNRPTKTELKVMIRNFSNFEESILLSDFTIAASVNISSNAAKITEELEEMMYGKDGCNYPKLEPSFLRELGSFALYEKVQPQTQEDVISLWVDNFVKGTIFQKAQKLSDIGNM